MFILPIFVLLLSCLKQSPEPNKYDNFFDPNYQTGIWFEEVDRDSFLYGGGTYYYNLYFAIISPELQEFNTTITQYRIMFKRHWKNNFEYVYGNSSQNFQIEAYPQDRVNGKLTYDFGILSVASGDLIRVHKHSSIW